MGGNDDFARIGENKSGAMGGAYGKSSDGGYKREGAARSHTDAYVDGSDEDLPPLVDGSDEDVWPPLVSSSDDDDLPSLDRRADAASSSYHCVAMETTGRSDIGDGIQLDGFGWIRMDLDALKWIYRFEWVLMDLEGF